MAADLQGTFGYHAGTSGTLTLPAGAMVRQIVAHASAGGATLTINGGDAIPIISGANLLTLNFSDADGVPGGSALVFTGTDHYFVQFKTIP